MPAIQGLHHASLSVADLDASVPWYCRVLDLQEVFREEGEHRRTAVLRFATSEPVLGLVEHRGGVRSAFDPTIVGLDHLAFTVAELAELHQWVARLDAAGISHSGVTDIPPGATVNFTDPDGIALALFWNRDANA